jgi:phosphatidylglycerol---prolipoprotein diacylglyceryl transferase
MYPILISIFGFKIHTYGVMMAIGFILSINLSISYGKKKGIEPEKILDLGLLTLLSVIIGGRLFLFIINIKEYLSNPSELFTLIFRLGGVYYGGLIVALIVDLIYLKRKNLNVWFVADILAPYIALGHSIGRIGCFSSGCCFGKPTNVPWAVTFTNEYSHEMFGVPLNLPIHPTQLYESFFCFALFLFLIFLRKNNHYNGKIFWSYTLLYSCGRYIIENFRGDDRGTFIFNFISTSQTISIILAIVSVVMLFYLYKKQKKIDS